MERSYVEGMYVHGCIHEACNCSSEDLHVAFAHLVYQFEITTVPLTLTEDPCLCCLRERVCEGVESALYM